MEKKIPEKLTPSQAISKIKPENHKYPCTYAADKKLALMKASRFWFQSVDEDNTPEKRRERIRQRILEGDEEAIYEYVKDSAFNLKDPLVTTKIVEWQGKIMEEKDPEERHLYRDKLKKIGNSLIPDMKGKRNNLVSNITEDIFQYLWENEWLWFYIQKCLDEDKDLNTIVRLIRDKDFCLSENYIRQAWVTYAKKVIYKKIISGDLTQNELDILDINDSVRKKLQELVNEAEYEQDDKKFRGYIRRFHEHLNDIEDRAILKVGGNKIPPYKRIAIYETAKKFNVEAKTIRELLSKYK